MVTRAGNDGAMSAESYRLRPARVEDGTAVRELLIAADLPVADVDAVGDGWVVAEAGGRVAGAAAIELHPPFGLLRSAVVDAHWRGRGMGQALTRDRLEWAGRQGLAAIWLLTTTAPEFFARFGFRAVNRAHAPDAIRASREFAELCPDSAVVMELVLDAVTVR